MAFRLACLGSVTIKDHSQKMKARLELKQTGGREGHRLLRARLTHR